MITSALMTTLESIGDTVGDIWPIIIAIGGLIGGLRVTWRIVRKEMADVVGEIVSPIYKELTPNGGGSIKDAVKRVEVRGEELSEKMGYLSTGLDEAKRIATTNHARMLAVLANFEAAYYEMDQHGTMLEVNDSYLRLFGLTEKEALSTNNWRKYVSDADLKLIDLSSVHAMEAQVDWYASFNVVRDGAVIPVVARAKPMFSGKDFIGFSGAMTYNQGLLPEAP